MKRRLGLIAFGTLIAAPLLFATPAAAGDWFWGTGFRIGGFHFQIGHNDGHRGHFYRTSHRIPSRYRCTDRCYVDRGNYYHHDSCPVVRFHLSAYGYSPGYVYGHYAPSYRTYRFDSRRYRDYRDHGRQDRYDRRDRSRDRRYERQDRRGDRRHDRYDRKRDRRDDRYDRRGERRDRGDGRRDGRRDRRGRGGRD